MTVTFAVGRLIDQLTKTIARYGRVDLLCLDELGYMELDRRGAELLFQVLSEREERSALRDRDRLERAVLRLDQDVQRPAVSAPPSWTA